LTSTLICTTTGFPAFTAGSKRHLLTATAQDPSGNSVRLKPALAYSTRVQREPNDYSGARLISSAANSAHGKSAGEVSHKQFLHSFQTERSPLQALAAGLCSSLPGALHYDVFVQDFQHERNRFAAHYSELSDGELLQFAMRSWELSEAAWEALEHELDRRHLELPVSEPVPQIATLEKRNLVILRRFRDLHEALLAKGKLESAGVPCSLADDNMVRMDWFISNLLGGVKILVDAENFTEAAKLLNEPANDASDFDESSNEELND